MISQKIPTVQMNDQDKQEIIDERLFSQLEKKLYPLRTTPKT